MQAINAPARAFGRSCRAQRSRGSTVRVRAEAITIPEQFTKVCLQMQGGQHGLHGGLVAVAASSNCVARAQPTLVLVNLGCRRDRNYMWYMTIGSCTAGVTPAETALHRRQVMPKGDKVLVKAAPAEEKTRGGILLPSMAVRKPTSGDVHTLGDGSLPEYKYEFYLKPGDTVRKQLAAPPAH